MATAIKVENLSKAYQLGEIGTGTLSRDLERWFAKVRGKEDPFLKIGETNDRTRKGNSDVVWSLKDIDFEIEQGDAVGIIGRNGAGKSTLLKLLSRVTSPTTGNIKVKGRIASLLEVGTGFHPELTGRENIYLNGAILGMRKKEITRKFDEIVEFSGVERYIDTPVKRYSSGMYVRLAFAVAAHLDSEILIVDEVLAVGDAEFQKKCLGKMGEVSKGEGRTVLFVSHQMGSVRDLCNSAIMLKNGSVYKTGSTDDVINEYLESGLQANEQSLKERSDREGIGSAKIKAINFLNPKTGNKLDSLISGEDLIIEVEYESKSLNDLLEDVVFGLAIHTQYDQFITPFNNKMVNCSFSRLSNHGKVYCFIPRFPLMSGLFYINAGLIIKGQLVDFVAKATTLTVYEGDYFKSGLPNANNRQGVYIDHTWEKDLSKIFDIAINEVFK